MNKAPNQSTKQTETLLNFPEKFPIKIFGLASETFHQSIRENISAHVDHKHILHWAENPSSKGNYVAVTVTIMAQNQQQLDAIYLSLTANAHVKMAL